MRRWIFLAASVIVSAVFLWLALQGVPLNDVINGIRQANIAWILASLVSVFLAITSRVVRWRGLLNNRISFIQAFHILNITNLLNMLPLRAGEVARSLLATRSGVPVVTAATSIVVERLLDVVAVVLMLAFALSRLPSAPAEMTRAGALFGVAAVAAFIVLIVFARYPQVADRLMLWFENRIPLIKRLNGRKRLDEVLDGLQPLTDLRRAAHAIVWTIIAWAMPTCTFYCLERAVGVENIDMLLAALLAVSLASFTVAIPVSVASIGPFEGAVRISGAAVGMGAVAATTLGFLYHGVAVLEYAVLGCIGLIAMGVSLADVTSQPMSAGD